MSFSVVDNVRGYFGSRPPLVVFMIFLGSMAVGLITFSCFIDDMPKASGHQEFHQFVERLSTLKLCVGGEDLGGPTGPTNSSQRMMGGRISYVVGRGPPGSQGVKSVPGGASVMTVSPSAAAAASTTIRSPVVNMSVAMTVEVRVTGGVQGVASRHNTSVVTATLVAAQLGRSGKGQDSEAVVTVVLPPLGNRTRRCGYKGADQCYSVRACVTLTAPRHFFPHSQRPEAMESCEGDWGETGGEKQWQGQITVDSQRCLNTSILDLQHVTESSRQAYMAMQDRSAINLHLMHSSYFLFVMVVSLFCYAIVKGRPPKVKVIHSPGPSDKHALIQV